MKTAILKLSIPFRKASYPETVAVLFRNFTMTGKATHTIRPATEWEEIAQAKKIALDNSFPKERHQHNVFLDRVSLIRKYQQIYLQGRYPFGVPENFLTGQKVCAIVEARHKRIAAAICLAQGNQ